MSAACDCRQHRPLEQGCALTPAARPSVPDHDPEVRFLDAISVGAPAAVREYLDGIRGRLDALPKPATQERP